MQHSQPSATDHERTHPGRLPVEEFASVVRLTPLISIDLIVRSPADRVLLGLRRNEPARDSWFVPGGRIRKNERLADAFTRIVSEELNVELAIGQARFFGVFEHLYDENFAERPGFGTHYVVLAYELNLSGVPDAIRQDQHDRFEWFSVKQILQSPRVHTYTRAYFERAPAREGN